MRWGGTGAALALLLSMSVSATAQSPAVDRERFLKVTQNLPGDGSVVISRNGVTIFDGATILVRSAPCPKPRRTCPLEIPFRWASVSKQVTAVLVMQEVAKGRIKLDSPVSQYLPNFASSNATKITLRQLLRHQSGLPNPDDTPPGEDGMASYYLPGYPGNRDPLNGYCAGQPSSEPGGNWTYNNCDYIVAGALLEKVTGKPWAKLVQQRIAKPLKLRSLQFGGTTRGWDYPHPTKEPDIDLGAFGAAAGIHGTPSDLIKFDIALMNGKLLPESAMKTLWDGQADLGYIALGQWVFQAPLAGCKGPVTIVERRGAIGEVQVRNFILPDLKIAAVAFVESPDFDFGEIWQGSGFSHDLLSEASCK